MKNNWLIHQTHALERNFFEAKTEIEIAIFEKIFFSYFQMLDLYKKMKQTMLNFYLKYIA